MDNLTLSDVTRCAIEARKHEADECDRRLASLLAQSSSRERDEEARVLELQRDVILKDVQWRELMAEAEEVVDGNCEAGAALSASAEVSAKIDAAVAAFRESLVEPADYRAEANAAADVAAGTVRNGDARGGEELVPYGDTDDYADLSAMENAVEDITDNVMQTLRAHSSGLRLRRGPPTTESGGRGSGHSSTTGHDAAAGAEEEACIHAQTRRRALLRLLLLSLSVGRLEALCGFDDIPDPSNVPTGDADDIREVVVTTWQEALYESSMLTVAEREDWRQIVADFLGPPFDVVPS